MWRLRCLSTDCGWLIWSQSTQLVSYKGAVLGHFSTPRDRVLSPDTILHTSIIFIQLSSFCHCNRVQTGFWSAVPKHSIARAQQRFQLYWQFTQFLLTGVFISMSLSFWIGALAGFGFSIIIGALIIYPLMSAMFCSLMAGKCWSLITGIRLTSGLAVIAVSTLFLHAR